MYAIPTLQAFKPLLDTVAGGADFVNSLTIAASTSAASGTLPGATGNSAQANPQQPMIYNQVQIANQTSAWAYVNIGPPSLTTATVAGAYPVAPGAVVVLTVSGLATTASVILAAGATAGSVTFTRGVGL